MATIRLHGTELHYEDLGGGGTPCLLLHGGLGVDHTYFRPAFDRLQGRLRLVYYDHRGNGRSARPPIETLTMEQLADDAAALASALGADRFLAIGHSYGGFVGQELALRHPGRLLGLVLLSTTPGQIGATEDPSTPQGDPPSDEQLAIMQSPVASDEEMAAMMGRLVPYYLHRLPPAELGAAFTRTVYSHEAMIRSSSVLESWSSVDRLATIDCPTLVVGGRHDTFTSAPQSARIAGRVPGAELRVFEHSGHFPWLEEPDDFWALLAGWLARTGIAGP